MKFFIISGMSGSGKSRAMATLEDLGYYCVDNMPVALIPAFADLCQAATGGQYERVALAVDVRAGKDISHLMSALDRIGEIGCEYKLIYLDTATPTLINRYKATRRKHPLMEGGITMVDAIEQERVLLTGVRQHADYVVDTTRFEVAQLRETIISLATGGTCRGLLHVNVVSFGFKYGIPADADLVFDVRFLPNPYYEISLREKTGQDPQVRNYVFCDGTADRYLDRLYALLDFLIPQYTKEGKAVLTIGIGCTGGRHRSVAIAEAVSQHVMEQNVPTTVTHRDSVKG
ncbi:RNase adapter RapZ [Butyricicoccus sp.]|uniref:RNase adapter RapZ n=1 Tax=Butyricicoccus sp. TaxID=2049021 RepID=UPI003F164CF9